MEKTPIVYFSQSGKTGKCAETIHSLIDSDLFEPIPSSPYSRGYGRLMKETKKEADEKADRKLDPLAFNPADYDRVFIGCPNWWDALPPPVRTFMRETNISGKEIAFFFTHGGSGVKSMKRRNKHTISSFITFSRLSFHLR